MSKLPVVAIIGRPNVGKSSVFNRLVRHRQAIVYDQPGTTRDSVNATVKLGGKQLVLVDTAGAASAKDQLAKDIQAQIESARLQADAIVMVMDASTPLSQPEHQLAKLALKSQKPLLLAVNKIDKTRNQVPETAKQLGIKQIIGLSAIHSTGSSELADAISALVPAGGKESASKDYPTLALLGRPNVGKSSLFNALVTEKKAIVSDIPGTTRDINQAIIEFGKQHLLLLDTAGLRRPGKGRGIEKISWLRTAEAIEQADVCAVLIDATEPSVAVDQRIAGMVNKAGKGLILVINKWDEVSNDDTRLQLDRLLQRDFAFAAWAPYILISAKTGRNVSKLSELVLQIILRRETKIKTPEFNKIIQEAMASHPPAGLKNRHPKLKYATQTGINPPEFTFFGTHLNFLHWSYKRYLEKCLREAIDFTGTPIKLIFKSRE